MGLMSLSFLLGDSLWRWVLGYFINDGYSWRAVIFICAFFVAIIGIIARILLKNNPTGIFEAKITPNPLNVFGEIGSFANPRNLRILIHHYLKSRVFWIVGLLSIGLTLTRETMNEWLNTYLAQQLAFSSGDAAQLSALFPLVGAFSVVLLGFISDHSFSGNRGFIISTSQFILALILIGIYYLPIEAKTMYVFWGIGSVAFFLIGPYTLIAGAIAMDLGAKAASGSSSYILDAMGYLATVSAGYGIASIVKFFSWDYVLLFLAGNSFMTGIVGVLYFFMIRKQQRQLQASLKS